MPGLASLQPYGQPDQELNRINYQAWGLRQKNFFFFSCSALLNGGTGCYGDLKVNQVPKAAGEFVKRSMQGE